MLNTTVHKIIKEIPAKFKPTASLENQNTYVVGAYARVSTEKDEQEDSFERQVEVYTTLINSRSDWTFGGIYADPGITGTRADKRPEFQRLMQDARAKRIDKILVKSIARFARNTVDALSSIRELKELGVSVYFENERIDTLTPGGEVLLTILAAMAEQESRTISSNVKWAYQKKFQNGDIQLNYTRFLGYTKDDNGKLVIVPEEAHIVQRIYREYLGGNSTSTIAKQLNKEEIRTPSNCSSWYPSVIKSILQNEKYYGAAILGKTYKPDVLSHKRYKNEGQVDSYFVEESHMPIVSKEMYDLVQTEMQRRNNLRGCSATNGGKFSSKYAFSKKIICGECGTPYRRHAHKQKGKYTYTWVCATHKTKGSLACSQKFVTEDEIKLAYQKVITDIVSKADSIKELLKSNIVSSLDDSIAIELAEVLETIDKKQAEMIKLHRDKRTKSITESEYNVQGAKVSEEIEKLNSKKVLLQSKADSSKLSEKRIEEIISYLDSKNITEEFDEETFKSIVEEMKITKSRELEIKFKVGITQAVKL